MNYIKLTILLVTVSLTGCMTPYQAVKDTDSAAFIRFERKIIDPILGSITRFAKVDDQQQCRNAYSQHPLLAVINKGNPLVSDLNLDGLYVQPGYFRILASTVAGGAVCEVFVGADIEPGNKYKMIVEGNVYISTNKCEARIYKMTGMDNGKAIYKEMIPVEYKQCNH